MLKTGLRCGFPILSTRDAVLHARKIAKWIVPFLLLPNFWRVARSQTPHFTALDTPKLHLCTLVPMPGNPVSHTPNRLLGYPKWPNGGVLQHIMLS